MTPPHQPGGAEGERRAGVCRVRDGGALLAGTTPGPIDGGGERVRLATGPGAGPRPHSEPHRFRQRGVPRRWRGRLAPESAARLRPRGIPGLWTRVRRLLWAWWPWAMAAMYAVANDWWGWAATFGTVALVAHLIQPQEHSPTYGLEHRVATGGPGFLDSVVGITGMPFLAGNQVELLNNGDEFYPRMLDAIRGARHSITVEAYIYWHGRIGLEFAEALTERSGAGVQVKLLLDAVGSATIGDEILERLAAGQCQVAWFNPIHWYTVGRFNHRTHRKSLVVDGRVGFTGGAGIADHWCGCAQDAAHWRDMQIRLEGPGVLPLQTGFAQNWLRTTGELVSGPAFFPATQPSGAVSLQTILSSPAAGSSTVRTLYYFSIVSARRSILIANPYFVPDQAAIDALVDARRRGVDVKIIVSGIRNDNWLARQNSVRLVGPLLDAGIEVHEYNRTMLHHKTMVVDGTWATIGTTNFDNRSFALNEESNVSFFEPAAVRAMEDSFLADLAACEPVTIERWRARGLMARTQEVVASLLQDQV